MCKWLTDVLVEVFYLKFAVLCKRASVRSNWQVYIVDTVDTGQYLPEVYRNKATYDIYHRYSVACSIVKGCRSNIQES